MVDGLGGVCLVVHGCVAGRILFEFGGKGLGWAFRAGG